MITLTTPAQINSVLGGNVPIDYDRLVLSPFTLDPQGLTIRGTLKLTSVANPDMQAIIGSVDINTSTGKLLVEVGQLDFYRRVTLSGAQIASVNTIIANAQNAIEAGLVTLGVVQGTQSTGA